MKKKKAITGKPKTVKDESIIEIPVYGMISNGHMLIPEGIPRTRRKVSIVGFAPSSMMDVQYVWDDPDMEVWGLNQLYIAWRGTNLQDMFLSKCTRWFQIHHKHSYEAAVGRDHSHHKWLAQRNTFPIYMQQKEEDVPFSIPFPVKEMLQKFRRYFTNSISWEIALAIYEGFEEIHLYGVDMAMDSEYEFERPSVEYFLGYAEGANIKLVIPGKCDILKSVWLYPFEDDAPLREKLQARRAELRGRINQEGMQEQNSHDTKLHLLGALENIRYIEGQWAKAARSLEGPGWE